MDTERKVFIVHHTADFGVIEHYIIEPLEAEELDGRPVKCVSFEKDFPAGKSIVGSIVESIKQCENTFVVLTRTSIDRQWVKYETLLALEKSQRDGRLCVTIILLGVCPAEVQHAWFGVLTDAMMIHPDQNKNGWENELLQQMLEKIKNPKPVQPIQVAVNLAMGQAWSHFTGYCNIVLPQLRDKIHASDFYKQNKGRFLEKEINLIPQSARTVRKLTDLHRDIQYKGDLDAISADRGSYKGRRYIVPVYSIVDPKTKLEYFFCAQIPNTLIILSKLEEDRDLSGYEKTDGKPALKISKGERSLQVARFQVALNRLVNHPKNAPCNNMVLFLPFDDTKAENRGEKAVQLLLTAVKEEIQKCEDPDQQIPAIKKMHMGLRHEDFENTVYVDCDDTTDCETAQSVKEFLKENHFQIHEDSPGQSKLSENLGKTLQRSKWCVLIVSKDALKNENSRYLKFKWRTMLHESVNKNEVRVIPVLDGVREDEIPSEFCAMTYLSKDPDGQYKSKLLDIIQCRSISIEATMSARDVYQGLAWAYVYNYLEVNLKDISMRLGCLQENFPNRKVYDKLLIIVPSSCSMPLELLDKNDKGQQEDSRFYKLPGIQIKKVDTGGVSGREYQLIPYHVQVDDQDTAVAMEYPNALVCLQEMLKLSVLSGLRENDLPEEAARFRELTQSIIDHTDSVRGKARLIYYDDTMKSCADAVIDVLLHEPKTSFLSKE